MNCIAYKLIPLYKVLNKKKSVKNLSKCMYLYIHCVYVYITCGHIKYIFF